MVIGGDAITVSASATVGDQLDGVYADNDANAAAVSTTIAGNGAYHLSLMYHHFGGCGNHEGISVHGYHAGAAEQGGTDFRPLVRSATGDELRAELLGDAETRPLAEEPRPAAAAVGTAWGGRVGIRRIMSRPFPRLVPCFQEFCQRGAWRVSTGVSRISSSQARLESYRFEGCQRPSYRTL